MSLNLIPFILACLWFGGWLGVSYFALGGVPVETKLYYNEEVKSSPDDELKLEHEVVGLEKDGSKACKTSSEVKEESKESHLSRALVYKVCVDLRHLSGNVHQS